MESITLKTENIGRWKFTKFYKKNLMKRKSKLFLIVIFIIDFTSKRISNKMKNLSFTCSFITLQNVAVIPL